MPSRPYDAIFLDDGGVMNDNALRQLEWQRLIGAFLGPRLGGDPRRWGEANRAVFGPIWHQYLDEAERAGDAFDGAAFWARQHPVWLREMCARVGVAAPPKDADCLALALETYTYVARHARASYPGAIEAIGSLQRAGYALHTASGTTSMELDGYLSGMGVRPFFGARLYGPDLVGVAKEHSEFYMRLFEDAGVAPARALVIDDSPRQLERAARTGASVLLVAGDDVPVAGGMRRARSLADAVAQLTSDTEFPEAR